MARRDTVTGGRPATEGVIPGRWALSVGRPSTPEPDGFHWTPLSSVARLESGHTPSRRENTYWDGGVPWIGIRDATSHHGEILDETIQTISELGLENSSARLLPERTVCLSRTASVGYVVMMGKPMATSQDFVNWVCGDQLLPQYLFHILLTEQESIRRFAHGTTHQTLYYPEAKAFHVLLPSKRVQAAIVEVLDSLARLIAECHLNIRKAVEAGAALIDRQIALGPSELRTVGDVATFHNHERVPLSRREREARQGEYRYFGATGVLDHIDNYLFDGRYVLVGEDGTVTSDGIHPMLQYVWGRFWVSNHAHVITGKGITTELLRCFLSSADVTSFITGAVQPKLSMGNLKAVPLQVPFISSELDKAISALAATERSAHDEALKVAELLALLAPRLLSGQWRVRGVQQLVEAS